MEQMVAGKGCVWDTESGGKWVAAFFSTWKRSIGNPVAFYEEVGRGSGLLRPWVYAMVTSFAAVLIVLAYQAGFVSFGGDAFDISGRLRGFFPAEIDRSFSFFTAALGIAVTTPITTTAGLIFSALIYHVCLMILGSAKRDLLQTFRVVCYSTGPQLFQIVPALGSIVAWGWQTVLVIVGVKVVHETTYSRSVLAVFLPTMVCCGLLMLVFSAIAGGLAAALLAR